MTLGELADLEMKRTAGIWRVDMEADNAIMSEQPEQDVTVAFGVPFNDSTAGIDIDEADAACLCAAVNALGPLLKLLAKCEQATASPIVHFNVIEAVREACRQARKEIEST